MKKLIKYLSILLFCLTINSSHFTYIIQRNEIETKTGIADYNEYYGIEVSTVPQATSNNTLSATQKLKYLAVFIEFADSDELVTNHLDDEQSIKNAELLLNSESPIQMDTVNGIIEVPSFKKYYEMQSYGKLEVSTEIFPKVNGKVTSYRDAHPMAYYLKYSESNPLGYKDKTESLNRETELINNAILAVKENIETSGISVDEIDSGNDGYVDAISFFIEGRNALNSQIGWGDLLWSHKLDNFGLTATILGKKVSAYNLLYTYDYTETAGLFSLNRGTYGTIMHEFGHTLGLMDLYRNDSSGSNPVGFYDIMGSSSGSNPQNLLAYFTSEYNSRLAWHKPLPVISQNTTNITLSRAQFIDDTEPRAIKLQIDPSSKEYFIVEYHQKQNTYASYSADRSGLIVYRVNENNKYSGNVSTSDHGELDHIFVFRPNEPSLGAGKGDLTMATLNTERPILGKNIGSNDGFDNSTIYYSNGNNSGIIIEVTSETDDSITFDVTFPTLLGSGTEDSPYIISSKEMFIYTMGTNTLGKYYKLAVDLDFKDYEYPSIDFQGNLDGNRKTIKNVTSKTGIFNTLGHFTAHTKVENFFIENISVTSEKGTYLGGFVSVTNNVTISNVHLLSGSVTNSESITGNSLDSTGGFAGNVSSDTTIIDSSSALTVKAPKNVGGFIGVNLNATIKNCFSTGTIEGSETIGSFIGLQCIMDTAYHSPIDVYYKDTGIRAVGGYSEFFHNQSALSTDKLDIGLIGVKVPENIILFEGETTNLIVTTTSNVPLNYELSIEKEDVASYQNRKLTGINAGTTRVFIDIPIGLHKMRLEMKVLVQRNGEGLTESAVLEYFGLTNKNGYVVGFDLGDSVQNIKENLSKLEGVTLKSFKNSFGIEINSGIISTNMKFTLNFSNVDYNYTVVIKGDVDGDGLIYATDYVRIKNHIMGKNTLTGPYYLAADIDNDRNIYAIDYVKVRNHIMGRGEIIQK